MKKIAAALCSFVFVLVGCAADSSEPEPSTNTGEDLISLGGGGGSTGWSQACYDCQKDCNQYPSGSSSRSVCLDLCVKAGKCTKTDGTGTFRTAF